MATIVCLSATTACTREGTVFASYPFDSAESVAGLELHAPTAEIVPVAGGPALRFEGMVLLPDVALENAGIEVEIFAEQRCYPGIVFRFTDLSSYELAYAVPHASGLPDAIQYDPVFNGANTWQLHNGAAYQQSAQVPTGEWFTLRVDVEGARATVQVGDQPPLVVEQLSHEPRSGRVGLWCFHPACFRNLRVVPHRRLDRLAGVKPTPPPHTITRWQLDGVGEVAAEANGVLNLNRFQASSPDAARLGRRFVLDSAGEVELGVGFSDAISVRIDDRVVHEGENTFKGFDDLASRGWVRVVGDPVRLTLDAGVHELEATLAMTEPFGWGLIATLEGSGLRLLPVGESSP